MTLFTGVTYAWTLIVAHLPTLLMPVPPAAPPGSNQVEYVGVAIIRDGQAVLLATPGLPMEGRLWRFRSLDTSDLPQPIRQVTLSASGTKLLIQPADAPAIVIDLTQQHQHNMPLQYVDPRVAGDGRSVRRHVHTLPGQHFVGVEVGRARLLSDEGMPLGGYMGAATAAAWSEDGSVLLARADGRLAICRARDPIGGCDDIAYRAQEAVLAIAARAQAPSIPTDLPAFLLVTGTDDATLIVDPERGAALWAPLRRPEAALRAALWLHDETQPDQRIAKLVETLERESAATWAANGESIIAWQFFAVAPDVELYAPVLQFAPIETTFPTPFDLLPSLTPNVPSPGPQPIVDRLYQRYLRLNMATRRQLCTMYVRTHSAPGSWIIEYWLYYPFDAGGLGSHPHDPEHLFVEVDKLGGAPRRVIGAGHGYMAGNNIYRADRRGAQAITLPIFAIVELGKHAMAPDIDRDGMFTPGIDENEYRERAKVWGVRDVIGSINNQLLAFDVTMSVRRRPEDALAAVSAPRRFPDLARFAATPACRLEPLTNGSHMSPIRRAFFRVSDWVILPPCSEPSAECARLHVTAHPDYLDVRTILKEWSFPQSFLRFTYGVGPRRDMHSLGLGYAMDLDRVPLVGRILPLPGRLGGEVFHWHQSVADADRDSCLSGCTRTSRLGWGLRYEQFFSNLFGIFSGARVYSPPFGDAWITFGPMVEVPLGRRSNVNLQGGLSFRPFGSPRFELKASVGLWKPKTNHIGLHAGKDH